MTRKADGIRRRWCKPSRPTVGGAHGYKARNKTKGVGLMTNENRWAIYARRAGHKKVHPCAPSRGLYNCPLSDMDRYPTKRAAEAVCAAMARIYPSFTFFVRYLRPFS